MVTRLLLRPFQKYNEILISHPLATKSITSGFMYAGGDVIAQGIEHYNDESPEPFKLNWQRISVFFIFGTAISGPAYHYWFNQLNELPMKLWNLKNVRHRDKILSCYRFLKAHGIKVEIDMKKLPRAKALDAWTEKFTKIAADQLIFSSLYNVILFLSLGLLSGGIDRYYLQKEKKSILNEPELLLKYKSEKTIIQCDVMSYELELSKKILLAEKNHTAMAELIRDEKVLLELLSKINSNSEVHDACTTLFWSDIWRHSWEKMKDVFWGVYITDCTVWPFLQLINFTFVPLRFQVLYVNICNLAWNAFISIVQSNNLTLSDMVEYLMPTKWFKTSAENAKREAESDDMGKESFPAADPKDISDKKNVP